MRGRLGFAKTLMFGEFGRPQLHTFPNRQYSREVRCRHLLNGELREVIPWWISALRTVSERKTMVCDRTVVIYVDAAGCGHIGAKVFMGGHEYAFSPHTPARMESGNADVYDFEMTASLFGVSLAAVLCPGRPVILRCDNMAESQTLVRGPCKTSTGRMLCARFWTVAATFGVPVWVASVAGTLNHSDPPTRDCTICNLRMLKLNGAKSRVFFSML